MTHPGFGVLLGYLGGNKETVKTLEASKGKKIASVALRDDVLYVGFKDGTGLRLADEGQSCCESRYMTTDDDLESFVGKEVRGYDLREGPTVTGEYEDEHEVQFLIVQTTEGNITLETHNEHNGYYGGFWIDAKPWNPGEADR